MTTRYRAEIRQWSLKDRHLTGVVYNDTFAVFFDGDPFDDTVDRILPGPGFTLVEIRTSVYKLDDSEERHD